MLTKLNPVLSNPLSEVDPGHFARRMMIVSLITWILFCLFRRATHNSVITARLPFRSGSPLAT